MTDPGRAPRAARACGFPPVPVGAAQLNYHERFGHG